MRVQALIACTALAVCACSQPATSAPQAETPAAVTLVADGDAQTLQAFEDGDHMQWAASVTQVDYLMHQNDGGSKLFGLAGGDPAMNGLYTHIAFFQGPGDGWRVFRIGDFLTYRVLTDSPGRVDLEIQESTMDAQTTEIGSRTRHLIISWTPGADGQAPSQVQVTPARSGP